MIEFGDEGFLYLCRQLRDDWRSFRGFSVHDLKCHPGDGGYNVSHDWTGLKEEIAKRGGNLAPPLVDVQVRLHKPGPEEREELGRTAHANWVAVRRRQRAEGQAVDEKDLRPWQELTEKEQGLFRQSGEALALPDRIMWEGVAQMRKKMGEKAFRKKMFELSVSVAVERMMPDWSEAERFRATHGLVGLSEMLEVPPQDETPPRRVSNRPGVRQSNQKGCDEP